MKILKVWLVLVVLLLLGVGVFVVSGVYNFVVDELYWLVIEVLIGYVCYCLVDVRVEDIMVFGDFFDFVCVVVGVE